MSDKSIGNNLEDKFEMETASNSNADENEGGSANNKTRSNNLSNDKIKIEN